MGPDGELGVEPTRRCVRFDGAREEGTLFELSGGEGVEQRREREGLGDWSFVAGEVERGRTERSAEGGGNGRGDGLGLPAGEELLPLASVVPIAF